MTETTAHSTHPGVPFRPKNARLEGKMVQVDQWPTVIKPCDCHVFREYAQEKAIATLSYHLNYTILSVYRIALYGNVMTNNGLKYGFVYRLNVFCARIFQIKKRRNGLTKPILADSKYST